MWRPFSSIVAAVRCFCFGFEDRVRFGKVYVKVSDPVSDKDVLCSRKCLLCSVKTFNVFPWLDSGKILALRLTGFLLTRLKNCFKNLGDIPENVLFLIFKCFETEKILFFYLLILFERTVKNSGNTLEN